MSGKQIRETFEEKIGKFKVSITAHNHNPPSLYIHGNGYNTTTDELKKIIKFLEETVKTIENDKDFKTK